MFEVVAPGLARLGIVFVNVYALGEPGRPWLLVDAGLAGSAGLIRRAVAGRFGAGARPDTPIQWLSDNGSIYTALDTVCTAERLHLEPITTPVASPESNGMSEAFVNTLKRDYVSGADRSSAAAALDAIPAWIAAYNAVAPHSALGYRAPQQYRAERLVEALTGV